MPHDFALTMEEDTMTPLRPVTTRWPPPVAAEEGAFAPPFVAGAAGPGRGGWGAVDPVAASEPEETLPVAEAAPVDEDLPMPWAEEAAPWSEESRGVIGESTDGEAAAGMKPWETAFPEDGGEAAPAWADDGPGVEEAVQPDRGFPLDAFLIPDNATRLPAGLENDRELQDRIATEVADALSAMVARLREDGLDALLTPSARREPVDVVLAAVLSGYLSRRAH